MALSKSAAAASAALRGWLLSPQVQLREGAHAGGVAGALDAHGRARYVYPEITGYYLHWLADVREAGGLDEVRVAAQRASDWARRQFDRGAIPLTRAYLGESAPDWRNDAVFFFDLSMLLRGVCAAIEARLIPPPLATLQRLTAELDAFVSPDGEIHAARALRKAELPTRWSTTGGPFEVKASSRVALAARHIALPERLARACEALADRYQMSAGSIALDMLHPTLYFAEGMLTARPRHASKIASLLQRCLQLQHTDGSLPEAERASALPRSDIIAQALRVGLLLRAGDIADAPTDDALHRLANALIGRVDTRGRMPFVPDDAGAAQPNVWCGLFAEQALRWYARWLDGKALPAAEWLV
jgi:hypothetical protein